MKRLIAVIVNEEELISDMTEANKIILYGKNEQKWTIQKEIEVEDVMDGYMADVRKNLDDIIKELDDCKILLGKSITGLVFNTFNQAGFILSELDEFDDKMLDFLYSDILEEYEEALAEKEANNIPTAPIETDIKGHYFFDFGLLKNSGSSLSSKDVLRPFLNETPFKQLEIICDHVMPWLETELQKRELNYTVTEISSHKFSVIIKP